MRALGVDYGRRRIGLALSDASRTLARPWKTLAAGATPEASAALLAADIVRLNTEEPDDAVDVIVIGLPRRLGGEDNEQTPLVREFGAALERATGLPTAWQDERLSSHEADQRLAEREPDWRRRKKKLDAAAAAIILQDHLDQHTSTRAARQSG